VYHKFITYVISCAILMQLSVRVHTHTIYNAIKYIHTNTIHTHTCVIPDGFEAKSFPHKYNLTIFEYKIHSVEVDLHYFK